MPIVLCLVLQSVPTHVNEVAGYSAILLLKGADAATPSEMTIKGPSENLFHRGGGGVWTLNGMALCQAEYKTESSVARISLLLQEDYFIQD